MNACFKYILCVGLLLAAAVLVGCGAGEHTEAGTELTAEPGHEGHNHGPGEHHETMALTDTEDPLADWCYEHSVPESVCTQCHPTLIAGFKESGDWCAGHDLPESHCRLCNPGITFPQEEILRTRSLELAENEIEIDLYFRPNASVCATDGALIQFASVGTADRAGLKVQAVRSAKLESTLEAPAETVFDETAATVVTSTVPALVSRWLVAPGDLVREGDVLAILKSADIAPLKSSLIAARAAYEVELKESVRHRDLAEREMISEADLDRQTALTEQARAEVVAAEGLLLAAGLNQADVDEITNHTCLSNQFALRASASGMVVQRVAQLGELLEAGRAFATIADPTSMWIEARLTEEQMRQVRLGDHLTFSSDGAGINRVGGQIIWMAQFLDPHTRTGTVRARVMDPDHDLRAGEFGRARLVRSGTDEVALVPKDAVQWEGCCNVVFVKETPQRYRPRKVALHGGDGPYYQVIDGVRPGEEVVVDGAFLLKTELKKSSIGAGCCGLDPVG